MGNLKNSTYIDAIWEWKKIKIITKKDSINEFLLNKDNWMNLFHEVDNDIDLDYFSDESDEDSS